MKLSRSNIAAAVLATCATGVLWIGSEASYNTLLNAIERTMELEAAGPDAVKARIAAAFEMRSQVQSSDPFALPPMWTVVDGVGILSVDGPLVSGSAGFMRLFGITGYDDIRQGMNELLSQKSVKSILLHVNSPGGMAAGCEDCSAHIKAAGQVKPVVTYSDTVMASGGYWLGSSGSPILAASTATLGSVGVLVTFVDMTKANEMAGRKVTVIRAGEYKQLANANEPLSKEGEAHLQSMADQMYEVFRDNVAANLGVDAATFDKKMGRGREFLGAKAVEVGLANQVATFDQAMAYAKNVDTRKLNSQNSRNPKGPSMKVTLATAIIMQLVAGADPSKIDFSLAAANMQGETPDAEGQTLLRAQAIEMSAGLKSAVDTKVAAAVAEVKTELDSVKATVQVKETELKGLRTTNEALTAQAETLKTDVSKSEAIVMNSLKAMCVALAVAEPKAELKGTELIAEHERVAADFAKKFPNARVSAAPSAKKADDTTVASDTPDFLRISAGNTAAVRKS